MRHLWALRAVQSLSAITMAVLLLALLAFSIPVLVYGEVLSLSGLHWTLKNQNGSIAIPAQIPSQAHLDLLRAGIITEPLLGINGEFCSKI
jgi:beta-mannosidase